MQWWPMGHGILLCPGMLWVSHAPFCGRFQCGVSQVVPIVTLGLGQELTCPPAIPNRSKDHVAASGFHELFGGQSCPLFFGPGEEGTAWDERINAHCKGHRHFTFVSAGGAATG